MKKNRMILTLKKKVYNPKPDRRSTNCLWAEHSWPEGSLWCFTSYSGMPPNTSGESDAALAHLDVFTMFGVPGSISRYGNAPQWDALAIQNPSKNGVEGLVNFEPYIWKSNYSEQDFNALWLLNCFDFTLLVKYLFAQGVVDERILNDAQHVLDGLEDSADIWRK